MFENVPILSLQKNWFPLYHEVGRGLGGGEASYFMLVSYATRLREKLLSNSPTQSPIEKVTTRFWSIVSRN